jgi:REP element-mobilizing transposase RayT
MSQDHNHLNQATHATWECKYHVVFTPKHRKKFEKSDGTWALYSTTWRWRRNAELKRGI